MVRVRTGPFRTPNRDPFDKGLLFVTFAVGILGTLFLKNLTGDIWPAIFAGCVIIFYALLTVLTKQARLEPDQVGDNCYYLGFTITLSSLAYILYEIGGDRTWNQFDERAISAFGIALSSTIVGVVARVVLMQFRNDLTARDIEARVMINKAMRDFSGEIQDSIRGTKMLGTEIRQSLDEHNKALNKATDERLRHATEAIVTTFRESLSVLVKDVEDANRKAADAVERVISNTTNLEAQTARFEQALVQVREGVSRAFSGIESGIDELNKSTARLDETTNQAVVRVQEGVSRTVSGIESGIESGIDELNKSTARLDETTSQAIAQVQEGVSRTVSGIESGIESGIDELNKSTARLGETTNQAIKSFEEQRENSGKAFSEMEKEVVGALGDMETGVRRLDKDITGIGKAVARAVARLDDIKVIKGKRWWRRFVGRSER